MRHAVWTSINVNTTNTARLVHQVEFLEAQVAGLQQDLATANASTVRS